MTARRGSSVVTLLETCAVVLGALTVLSAGCGGGEGAPPAGGAAGKHGPTVLGETLTTRVVDDPLQKIPAGVLAVPAGWKYTSAVTWNYAQTSNPVALSASAENPANEEAVYFFPAAHFFDMRPVGGYYRVGQNSLGLIYAHPEPPVDTLARFILQTRGREPNLTFVGSKDLPGLPAALNIPASPNQYGVGIKVTYTLNGKPVEEEFYAVWYQVEIPYDGPQGRTWQINWGLLAPHSFRAPAGTLDSRRPVFSAVAKSFRPNPMWQQRLAAINAYLTDQFNRQLQAGYDRIAAAARLSRQISANNDAMLAAVDRRLAESRAAGGAEARSSAEKFDEYIRGVDTVEDPYYGTSQHSYDKQFHWTDGYGNYKNSNDATYDPNRTEIGNWQLMKVIR